jgi:hypothetical protein
MGLWIGPYCAQCANDPFGSAGRCTCSNKFKPINSIKPIKKSNKYTKESLNEYTVKGLKKLCDENKINYHSRELRSELEKKLLSI